MTNICCCTIYEAAGDIKIGIIAEIGLMAADFRGIAHAVQESVGSNKTFLYCNYTVSKLPERGKKCCSGAQTSAPENKG